MPMRLHSCVLSLVLGLSLAAVCGCGSKQAPDFKAESLAITGKTVTLADFKGKAVLLEFWATWCGPCRETMPVIDEVYKEFGPKGLQVVSLTNEDRATVEAFAAKSDVTYPLFLDVGGSANQAYGITGIPDAVVIGKNGSIVWRGHPADVQALVAAVERALEL